MEIHIRNANWRETEEETTKDLKLTRYLPNLCDMPSLPEPEPAFPLSPALEAVFAEGPFNFLDESRYFPSAPFPSISVFCWTALGV